jgi:hypothetical protein
MEKMKTTGRRVVVWCLKDQVDMVLCHGRVIIAFGRYQGHSTWQTHIRLGYDCNVQSHNSLTRVGICVRSLLGSVRLSKGSEVTLMRTSDVCVSANLEQRHLQLVACANGEYAPVMWSRHLRAMIF